MGLGAGGRCRDLGNRDLCDRDQRREPGAYRRVRIAVRSRRPTRRGNLDARQGAGGPMATLHQGEDVARTVAAVVLVPVRTVLHRRVSRGLPDDPLLRSALDPGRWRRAAGWRGLDRASAWTYHLRRAALPSRPCCPSIFILPTL